MATGLRSGAGKMFAHSRAAKRDEVFLNKARLMQAKSPEDLYRIQAETERTPLGFDVAKNHIHLPYKLNQTGRDVLGEVNHDIMLMDMKMYHPDDILVKVDRSGMAVSLESRIPLLDPDVIEFAWSLPMNLLRDPATGQGKQVLRNVLYRHVPKELVDRPKKGFSIPIASWLKTPELKSWAEDLIAEDKLKREGYLNPKVVHKIWNDFAKEDGAYQPLIWYILMFEQWLEYDII